MTTRHQHYMSHALALARLGRCTVSPNPMVGCVLVKDDCIIGEGYHQRTGGPHAEIIALEKAGNAARGATAYVTLEPCCHHGRTPPCTDALIKAGIREVYVAINDPNPLVAGKGINALQAAGIAVTNNICAPQAADLNAIFFHYIRHKKPFVIAKWAMSLDGKTVTHGQDTRDISGQEAQAKTHDLRQQVDAILVGANTVIHDNPLLTARPVQETITKQPLRIILSSTGLLPPHLNIFDQQQAKTLIVTTQPTDLQHVDVWVAPRNAEGCVDLHALLTELGKREITSLLVEGGMTMLESFFAEQLVNKTHVYIAPVIIGKFAAKQRLYSARMTSLGEDIHVTAHCEGQTYV